MYLQEKAMATHSSTLAWKILWAEKSGRLQSMGSWRVGHDWATSLWLFTFLHWRRKWQPTPVFLPGESQGRGSLVGCCLWGHTESDTTEATLQQQQQQESVEEEKKTPKFWPEQLGRWCHLLRWGRLGRCESKFHFEHVKYDRYRSTWICQIGNWICGSWSSEENSGDKNLGFSLIDNV